MKRRRFLLASGIGVTAVAVSAMSINSKAVFRRGVASMLSTYLPYLKFSDSLVEQFITDLEEYISKYSFTAEQKTRFHVVRNYVSGGSTRNKTTDFIVTKFLLSTDFFLNNMDESKPLQYQGLHGSLGRACRNPFSHLYYPGV